MNALYRPGPDGEHPVLHRLQARPPGGDATTIPALEPILQGHLRRVRLPGAGDGRRRTARRLLDGAGATSCGARWGRRSRRRWRRSAQQFVDGCAQAASIPQAKAEKIFATMEKFAGYGFNKSHSRRLRAARVPVRLPQGALPGRVHGGDADERNGGQRAHRDADRGVPAHGLELLPPDVNRSEWQLHARGRRDPLRARRGAERRARARSRRSSRRAREGGPFHDLFDLAARLDARGVNRRVLESLVAAGACDALGGERGALFAAAGARCSSAPRRCSASARAGSRRCSATSAGRRSRSSRRRCRDAPAVDAAASAARSEKEVLGFYFSEHPLAPMRERARAARDPHDRRCADARGRRRGAARRAGRRASSRSSPAAGKPMAFVTLEDLTGRIECTVFPDAFEACARSCSSTDAIVVGDRAHRGHATTRHAGCCCREVMRVRGGARASTAAALHSRSGPRSSTRGRGSTRCDEVLSLASGRIARCIFTS